MRGLLYTLTLILPLVGIYSCSDDINPESRYTFKGTNISQYIAETPNLSLFNKLSQISHVSERSQSSVSALLGTVGQFTVFIPTDSAITNYLNTYYGTDNYKIDTIPQGVANRIIRNCVVRNSDDGKEAWTMYDLSQDGTRYDQTLGGQYLITKTDSSGFIHINYDSRILKGNINLDNGIVHIVDKVIEPSPATLSGLIEKTENLKIFSHLLQETGWEDSLLRVKDNSYKAEDGYIDYKLYGYTAFVETDDIFFQKWQIPMPHVNEEKGGIDNWDEIMTLITNKCKEIYPNALSTDLKSAYNAVNQFVSYHLLPCSSSYKDLIITQDFLTQNIHGTKITPDGNNFFQTMSIPYRLLKVTKRGDHDTGEIWLNRRSVYDDSYKGTYKEITNIVKGIHVNKENGAYTNYCPNGHYYTIDDILLYSNDVRNIVLNDRIRFNIKQVVPEVYNCVLSTNLYSSTFHPQPESFQKIKMKSTDFDNLYFDKEKDITITRQKQWFTNWENTILYVASDNIMIMPLLTVPFSGNWEIRITPPKYDYSNGGNMYNVEIGTNPTSPNGLQPIAAPLTIALHNLTVKEDNQFQYGEDTISAREYDKQLRSQNMMKGPQIVGTYNLAYKGTNKTDTYWNYYGMRDLIRRYIIYRGYLKADTKYYIKIQGLLGSENSHYLNLYELVPESIYNNPYKAEDIW